MSELIGLFLASFVAATLVPMPSEAALWGYLMLYPDDTVLAVSTATVGNTLGGMTTYLLGRFLPQSKKIDPKVVDWVKKYGAPLTFLAWLPVVGDALCAAAGWLRVHWLAALAFMAAGRLARYLGVVFLLT